MLPEPGAPAPDEERALRCPPGAPVTTESVPTTREAIMQAALELFAERGFHGTAVPLVAERANVATGSIYRHFPSKEALANSLYQHWRNAQVNALFSDFPTGQSARASFSEIWRRLARFYSEHPGVFTFLETQNHSTYLDEESRASSERVIAPLLKFLERSAEEKIIKPLPPRLLLAIADGAFLGTLKFAESKHFALTQDVLDATEQCCWEAIRL